jgi:2-polyprenyl-6-methoxyphenol hydroxylase-like FAD-dependent oxidoreductase
MEPGKEDEQLAVLIVGAGPTGLTLAVQLRALGVPFRIVDRQLDRARESRALAIQPRTLELLSGLGISQRLVERGNDAVELQMHAGERVVSLRLFEIGLEDTAYPFLLFVSQAETEDVLSDHLAKGGVPVERGVELVALARGAEEVACTLRHRQEEGETVRARYLVGCDGAHSTVRDLAGIPFEGAAYPQTFALGDLDVNGGLDSDTVHAFLGPAGMLFFFPLDRPAPWRMIGMAPSAIASGREQAKLEASLDELQAIVDTYTDNVRLRDPVWLSYFRIHHRQAARYRSGRVLLAGDAAHVHSPAGAQGMNTGIQDSWNLGWKLALVDSGVAEKTLLDSYEAERLPIGRFVLRFTDRAFSVATSHNPLVRFMRIVVVPRLAPLLLRLDRARAFGFRTIAQLALDYRRSPAVQEGSPALNRGPKAGDRLPDARVSRDGETFWLQEALEPTSFHIFLCGSGEDWDEDRLAAVRERYGGLVALHRLSREPVPGALHDRDGAAFARLGVERVGQYLVRPDGYIAYRSAGSELLGLERYLAQWLPGAAEQPSR